MKAISNMGKRYTILLTKVILLILVLMAWSMLSCDKPGTPAVVEYSPKSGFEGTLITVKGMNFESITGIFFNDGVAADFNPSFGTDSVLLFRVPEEAPLGENDILIETDSEQTTIPFRVTLEPPQVKDFAPKSANEGEVISIIGENFFEPLEVLFFDSIPGKILYSQEDSLSVEVPPGVEKGRVKVKANGGFSFTAEVFFSTTEVLINDFDGNGLRSETEKWLFYGNLDESGTSAVHNTFPNPIMGNFLKIKGTDPGTVWVGGTESHSNDPQEFTVFPIQSNINNTFFEADVNNNGSDKTHVIIILAERGGSPNDFSTTIQLEKDGWQNIRIPLNRFMDIDGATVDPQIIRTVKFHLYNELNSSSKLEANIDNIKFIQIN